VPPEPPQFPGSTAGGTGGDATVTPVPPTGRSSPPPGAGTFRGTGLPERLRYRGIDWTALELIEGLPATLLEADDQKADGLTVYSDRNAEPPYAHVYVRVAGETDQYVRYTPNRL
jgi:hypothetical protein